MGGGIKLLKKCYRNKFIHHIYYNNLLTFCNYFIVYDLRCFTSPASPLPPGSTTLYDPTAQ